MHNEIIQLCSDIEKLRFSHIKLTRRQVLSRIKKIEKLTLKAKLAGQSMEDRLAEYYEAIISVGFKRKR